MNDTRLQELQTLARDFRGAIELSRAQRAAPVLPYFPEGACRLVSRLLALHLTRHGTWPADALRFVSGHVPGTDAYVRHTWLAVDDVVVDLTADPFGEPPVIAGPPTAFHDSLGMREEQAADAVMSALSSAELDRLQRLLGPIEARLPGN